LNIKRKYPKQIKYLKNKDASVYTKPSENLKSFVNQRIRWASKSTRYTDFFVNFVGIIVLLTNLALFVIFLGVIFQVLDWKLFLLLLTVKSIVDFPLLFVVSKFFSKQKFLFLFLPLQIIYFFYVVIIGVLSFFVKSRWK
jgi:poly-beta-1,6-N-acetyl-D-glucosamine synthase